MGSKSIKNPKKWCPGAFRKRSWKTVDSRILPGGVRTAPSLMFLAPLGRFWAPFWAQLGAKGLPKSSFLAPSRTKISKNEVQNEASKNIWNFDRNFMRKCEILDVLNPPKCFVWRHSGGWHILWQNRKFNEKVMPKWSQKSSQNRHLGDQGSNFWGFWRCFEECVFLWFLRCAKSRPKMRKVRRMGGLGRETMDLWGGSAAEAVVLGT